MRAGRRPIFRLAAIGLVAAIIAGAALLWFDEAETAPGPLASPETVIVQRGAGLSIVARQLHDAGVISAAWLFHLKARYEGLSRALKPGEYHFEPRISVADVLARIVEHDVVLRQLTIPEGLQTEEILQIIAVAEGLVGEMPVVAGEGLLLPETYQYEWGDARTDIAGRMKVARDKVLETIWASRAPSLPLEAPEEAMILASIVEKETGVAAERPRITAVFLNRLRRGMRLQSDPTVLFSRNTDRKDHPLTYHDLAQPTSHNTYVIDGLPPSPICNPGRAAIAAVLQPTDTSDLYFVADGSGGHAFATNLADHNRNVARWRRWVRANRDTK